LLAGALSGLLPRDTAKRLAEEGGIFETASALFLGAALLLILLQLARAFSTLRLAGAAMLLWAVLRELDFQKRFTYRSVESLGYYTRPHAPWTQKLLVLLILAPFVAAGLLLVRELCRRFLPACRGRLSWVCHVVAAVVLVLFASVSEKVFRLQAAEEILEAGIAVLIFMLVWDSRPRSESPAYGQATQADA
jgi:hypothetical protein